MLFFTVEELNQEKEDSRQALIKAEETKAQAKKTQLHVLGNTLSLWMNATTDKEAWRKWVAEDVVWTLPVTMCR